MMMVVMVMVMVMMMMMMMIITWPLRRRARRPRARDALEKTLVEFEIVAPMAASRNRRRRAAS